MKSFCKHLAPLRRTLGLLPQIETIGWLPDKRECIKHPFATCNFSFIVKGRGEYGFGGRKLSVEAPCLLLQWPDTPMDYGPNPGSAWDELYMIYPARFLLSLRNSGAFDTEYAPVRRFRHGESFESALRKVMDFCSGRRCRAGDGDRGDLLCWELISAAFTSEPGNEGEDRRMAEIRRHLEAHPASRLNLDELASAMQMSKSTLRRYWESRCGSMSFGEYRDETVMRESRRMLVETNLEIKEIAAALGFDDPYYFSRKFRRMTGMTASAYRSAHKTA